MASSVLARRVDALPTLLKVLLPIAGVGVVRSWAGGYVCREDRLLHDKTFILVVRVFFLLRTMGLRFSGCREASLGPGWSSCARWRCAGAR